MNNFGVPFGNGYIYDTKTNRFTSYRNYIVAKPHINYSLFTIHYSLKKEPKRALFL